MHKRGTLMVDTDNFKTTQLGYISYFANWNVFPIWKIGNITIVLIDYYIQTMLYTRCI